MGLEVRLWLWLRGFYKIQRSAAWVAVGSKLDNLSGRGHDIGYMTYEKNVGGGGGRNVKMETGMDYTAGGD